MADDKKIPSWLVPSLMGLQTMILGFAVPWAFTVEGSMGRLENAVGNIEAKLREDSSNHAVERIAKLEVEVKQLKAQVDRLSKNRP